MRRAFWVTILSTGLVIPALAGSHSPEEVSMAPRAASNERVLFDFSDPREARQWFSVNDTVMGGVSSSSMTPTEHGTAIFEGFLSLENNGGFATVRSRNKQLGLEGRDSFAVRVRGDGRTYSLLARVSDDARGAGNWRYEFETSDGEWIEIHVPFAAMHYSVRGRRVAESGMDPSTIRSLSFMIADKKQSEFALEIDWIKAY